MSDDLKFPIDNESFPPAPKYSMEDYALLVEMHLRTFGFSEKQRQRVIKEQVDVPFRL